jgi:hypothetical protein
MDEIVGAIDRAVYDTVHGYFDPRTGQRGAVALAPKLGMQPGTLSNKANPLQEHQLTLRESASLQLGADDFRILKAYAASLGHAVYALPPQNVSDVELLNQYAAFHAAVGEKAEALRAALGDGRIDQAEVEAVKRAVYEVAATGLAVVARLEVLAG